MMKMKVDKKDKDKIKSVLTDKERWFENHVLSQEQVARLIQEKIQRAKQYQYKVKDVFFVDD